MGTALELRCEHLEQREVPTGCSWSQGSSKLLMAEVQAENQPNQESTARPSHTARIPLSSLCGSELCHFPQTSQLLLPSLVDL